VAKTATEVRAHIAEALRVELIGPYAPDEVLRKKPSKRYFAGLLAPKLDRERIMRESGRSADISDAADASGAPDQGDTGLDEDQNEPEEIEQEPGRDDNTNDDMGAKRIAGPPSSIGLSVLLPPAAEGATQLTAVLRWGAYEARPTEENKRKLWWHRVQRGPVEVTVPLNDHALAVGIEVPNSGGVRLRGKLTQVNAAPIAGYRALALFVVNEQPPETDARHSDQRYMFQVELELHSPQGFAARPDFRFVGAQDSADADDMIGALQYRDLNEFAVGHGIATATPPTATTHRGPDGTTRISAVATECMPVSEVKPVATHEIDGVETSMQELAQLHDGAAVRAAFAGLPVAYRAWIASQNALPLPHNIAKLDEVRTELLADAELACQAIEEGIALLASNAQLLRAFTWANHAMAEQSLARAAVKARKENRTDEPGTPRWRLFQLAFLLSILPSLEDPQHRDRSRVELIYFPTGGGKTEAYLGAIAFMLLLRRLRGVSKAHGGLGVAVLLRYTLRLLTIDQTERAAALICALELLRRSNPTLLGEQRFALGMWVGGTTTPNSMADAVKQIDEFRNSAGRNFPAPLVDCPWCGAEFIGASLHKEPSRGPKRILLRCANVDCVFSERNDAEGVPFVYIDEQIYRELPCFIVATVDKFAMLPFKAEAGRLFGRVAAKSGPAFFGVDDAPRGATPLPNGILPPELIVQDELHLIAGPLGTMVGLYETAIDFLCRNEALAKASPQSPAFAGSFHHGPGNGANERTLGAGPKIIASTATVRRASEHVKRILGRQMRIFPPTGIDPFETFFSKVDHTKPGRLYVGVSAPGRTFRRTQSRVYQTLLGAAQFAEAAGDSADAYMTLVGYFNNLRDLGAMRRVVEGELIEQLRPRDHEGHGQTEGNELPVGESHHRFVALRQLRTPCELTSRERTENVKQAKVNLALPATDRSAIDVLLASNMISVGVDIDRLGLMVVTGQPITTAEYIQASSRVGRRADRPGLVVTLYNARRLRDRSYYERFGNYHQSFYRLVESFSATPFAGPARERGLAGVVMAMLRHKTAANAPAEMVNAVINENALCDGVLAWIAERAAGVLNGPDVNGDEAKRRIALHAKRVMETWRKGLQEIADANGLAKYSEFDSGQTMKPLLLASGKDIRQHVLHAPTSMRDTERTSDLWVLANLGRPQ
jgi:hypothetical protein